MSVVAYKGGVLAADSRAYGGSYQPSPGCKMKIHRLDDGSRVGVCSGTIGMPERYVAWLRSGADPAKFGSPDPECRVLMVKPNGDIYIADDGLYFSGPIQSEFYAIGSGSHYAMGAMAMGATAEQAVHVACLFDQHCGGEIVTMEPEPR